MKDYVLKHRPKLSTGKKMILSLPLLLSLSFMAYLQFGSQITPQYGEMLAPGNTAPLMIALIMFTAGYILFLVLMFSENLQEMVWRLIGH